MTKTIKKNSWRGGHCVPWCLRGPWPWWASSPMHRPHNHHSFRITSSPGKNTALRAKKTGKNELRTDTGVCPYSNLSATSIFERSVVFAEGDVWVNGQGQWLMGLWFRKWELALRLDKHHPTEIGHWKWQIQTSPSVFFLFLSFRNICAYSWLTICAYLWQGFYAYLWQAISAH